jgi:uncharacterized protein with HEPN domain
VEREVVNLLTQLYSAVDDETVFALARSDVPELRRECSALLELCGARSA